MGATQIVTSVTIIQSFIGQQAVSLTNYSTSALSAISQGSKLEVAGAFFSWAGDETPNASSWTAIATAATAYLQCTPSGTAGSQILTASWTSMAPTWSPTKQGWYASAASVVRVIGSAYKNGAASQWQKRFCGRGQSDEMPVGTILPFDGTGWTDNVTLPGWYACIAANAAYGCPDLVDRFTMGKAVAGAGATGGSNMHTLTTAELPPHTHITVRVGGGANLTAGSSFSIGDAASGDGGFANTAISMKPAYWTVIYIRKCL